MAIVQKLNPAKEETSRTENTAISYTYRNKTLLRVFPPKNEDNENHIICCAFISLRYDATRERAAAILNNKLENNNMDFSIYLSNGWEDIIVFFHSSEPAKEGNRLFTCLNKIYSLDKLILNTETVFTEHFKSIFKNNKFKLLFTCSITSGKIGDVREKLMSLEENINNFKTCNASVYDMFGSKDFLITLVPFESTALEDKVFDNIYSEIKSAGKNLGFRFETQILLAAKDAHTPSNLSGSTEENNN